ncbi:MAG: tRNA pseudouridine(13) synthase TruD [Candidatus Nanoarchaeia archaeon]|jgi:tRNA pseudouridine13 synthase|nr:tRNA pseudouridine(13) synthase TruD [Candidatus Nanoarchaeia archaeon]MDD3994008.1 tRNA pseudouridine(13) synthase TruD [Candidatus Nanoarchaeia archaeon]MDD4563321.1 tRNA pseudouridine(13) synthase TruD [Candidatus Nanoarchaeia archaeon]
MNKEKIPAKFKVNNQDFIVEEITKDEKICSVNLNPSDKIEIPEKPLDSKREFLWCEFQKQNIDQFRALKEFSSQIRKGLQAIGFAGTKDKNAITCQQISIFNPDLELIKNFKHNNIQIKNFHWEKRKIKLGYLKGNHFKITLRAIEKKDSIQIISTINKTKNFPNYFGPQRFGSVRQNNPQIGKLIIKRKFKEAINTILTQQSQNERTEVNEARKRLSLEKDYKNALTYFPEYLKFERQILNYLVQNSEDYIGVINKIERKQFLMYIHSLQSLLFNQILESALLEKIDFNIKGQQKIPLFGYKSNIDSGKLGEIEEEILNQNNIQLQDFNIQEIPYLRVRGDLRNALISVEDIIADSEDDELFPESKKVILEFSLPSGVYATTFLNIFFELIEEKRQS